MSDERRDRKRPEGDGAPEWVDRQMPGYEDATRGDREVEASEVEAHEESLPEAGEHDFEPDVEQIHRPLLREPHDPVEGREPAPWWLWAIVALSLFWGGWYLGRYGGTFGIATHVAYGEAGDYVEEQAAESALGAVADPIEAGAQVYTARCQQCHQQTGLGLPPAFPPLIGSEWVTGSPELPVLIVLHGLAGPIEVAGEMYSGMMPGWQEMMTDAEIAAVVSYIRQWDQNDSPPVSPETVTRLREATADRQQPWTADELRAAAASPAVQAAVQGGGAEASPAPPDTAQPGGTP